MTDGLPPGEKERVSFAAVVLLLRQMAHQLIQDGRPQEARGLIDGIDAIRAKTRGNVTDEEARFLDDIVYDLQMSSVRGSAGAGGASEDPESTPEGEGGG
ncbi:MAG: DUF1844 domain-containing protein [bacterium]